SKAAGEHRWRQSGGPRRAARATSAARPLRRPRARGASDSSSRAAPGAAGTLPAGAGATRRSRQDVDQPVDLFRADIEVGGSAHPPGARRSHDLLPAEQAHRLGGVQAGLAEGDDAGAVPRGAFAEELVAFGLDTGGNAVAEILDNGGDFSWPDLK